MAMGIIQALELQEGPIDALTKLDQKQIIALAQQKRIPQDMVSVILNEKALNEQEAANIAAAQKPMSRSVIEQAMAINAQAEAMRNKPRIQPQMMAMASEQEMPPMDTGVASLPVPEEMYSGEGYAGGGIVAFDNGGGIDLASMYNTATKEMDEESARRVPNPYAYSSRVDPNRVEELVGTRGSLRDRIAPESEEVRKIKEYLADQARKTTDTRTDAWTRALEASLGIMGGESPYALTNIGKGSQAALKGFAEDVKERRKQKLTDMQLKLQLEEAARKEKLGDITAAEATALKELEYGRDLEKSRIAAQKEKVMDTYAMNFLEAYRGRPDFKGLTDTQILQLGREDYLKRSTAFDPRMLSAQAAMSTSNVGANRESTQDYEAAAKIIDPMIARGGSKYKEYKRIRESEGQDAADAFREKQIQGEITRMRGGRGSTAPAAPAAAPTPKKGNAMFPAKGEAKFEVKTPDGRTFTFPDQKAADAFKARIGAAK
jgi:hypothetical protein